MICKNDCTRYSYRYWYRTPTGISTSFSYVLVIHVGRTTYSASRGISYRSTSRFSGANLLRSPRSFCLAPRCCTTMSKRRSDRASAAAPDTPGFQFTKKRRVSADASVATAGTFDYSDVRNTPGLVVNKRVTRSAAKAHAQRQQHQAQQQQQRSKQHNQRATKKISRSKAQTQRRGRSAAVTTYTGPPFPSYPSIKDGKAAPSTASSRAQQIYNAINSVVNREMEGLERTYDRPSCAALFTVMKDVASEFVDEADRFAKHETSKEEQQARPLKNPENDHKRAVCEKLQMLIDKLRREDELWQQARTEASEAQQAPVAQGEAENTSDVPSTDIAIPDAAELDSSITFFAKQIEHMRRALHSVKQTSEKVEQSHSRMSRAMKEHSFKGYARVKNPKSLLRGLISSGAS